MDLIGPWAALVPLGNQPGILDRTVVTIAPTIFASAEPGQM